MFPGDAKIPGGCHIPQCNKLVWRILDELGLNSRVIFRFFFQQSSVLAAKGKDCNCVELCN